MQLDRRVLALDVVAVAIVVAVLACAHDPSADLIERYRPTLEDAGLGWGLGRLNGLSIRVHPLSDGESFPNPRYDGGAGQLAVLFDDASYGCASYPGERVCWVNSLDNPIVGHCLAHVARSDLIPDAGAYAGICIDDLPRLGSTDHEYFTLTQFDAKCRELASSP